MKSSPKKPYFFRRVSDIYFTVYEAVAWTSSIPRMHGQCSCGEEGYALMCESEITRLLCEDCYNIKRLQLAMKGYVFEASLETPNAVQRLAGAIIDRAIVDHYYITLVPAILASDRNCPIFDTRWSDDAKQLVGHRIDSVAGRTSHGGWHKLMSGDMRVELYYIASMLRTTS